jgi:hypothetical protein
MAETLLRRRTTSASESENELLSRLDSAQKTIRTLEQRVAMQEKSYITAMQEKNREIRKLQLSLQNKN